MPAPSPRILLSSLAGMLFMLGCGGTPPVNPPAESLTWRSYRNPVAGYVLEIPDAYSAHEHHGGKDVLLRYHGYPVIALNLVSEEEGKERGLWPGKASEGETELGGLPARRYVYRHYDGPFSMRVVSSVAANRGREMGLEFRTENLELDDVQKRILASFRFE